MLVVFLQRPTPLGMLPCPLNNAVFNIAFRRIAMARMGEKIPLGLVSLKMLNGMLQAAMSGVAKKSFFQKESSN